jgi:hypothetical protein
VSLKGFLKKYLINSMVYDKKAGTRLLSLAVPEMSLTVFGGGLQSPFVPHKIKEPPNYDSSGAHNNLNKKKGLMI